MKNHRIISCCFLFFSFNTLLFSQDSGYLTLISRVINAQSVPLKDVKVKLIKNTEELTSFNTRKNGQFNFNIYFDDSYKITFSKPGYIDMYLVIDAATASGDIFPEYKTEITLYADTTQGINAEKFKDPFLKLIYDGKENFIPDEEYATQFKKSVEPNDKTTQDKDTTAIATTTTINPPLYSKNNYPEKFAFIDTNKDNVISLVEVKAIIQDKKEVASELIDWFFD